MTCDVPVFIGLVLSRGSVAQLYRGRTPPGGRHPVFLHRHAWGRGVQAAERQCTLHRHVLSYPATELPVTAGEPDAVRRERVMNRLG